MKHNNQWLIMTYYCPTHGSQERSKQIELTTEDLRKAKNDFKNNKDLEL